jgi:hypothetical protein
MKAGVQVRGAATAEEVAAVVAALHAARPPAESGYARWRRQRLAALRSSRSIIVHQPGAGSRPNSGWDLIET